MAGKKILLVEGRGDKHVLMSLCDNRYLQDLDEIATCGSVNQLLDSFPIRLKESDIEALGVVIDADTDLAARWQSLRDRLTKAGYQSVPSRPVPTGTILDAPVTALLPRVGVWIMPDNQTTGILEDFLQLLIPDKGVRLFAHVESSVATIPEGERRFNKLAEPKAIIYTWLAWQQDPGKSLGDAVAARYFDANVAQVDVLVDWLNRLFFQ